MNTPKTKYDVVISFAGEQKDIAVGICIALRQKQISSYYYPYRLEENIGKELGGNLSRIYQNEAVLAIAVLSPKYFTSKYTMIELQAILKRTQIESDYFIPIRLGNFDLAEYLKDYTYYQWDSNLNQIAQIVGNRLRKKIASQLKESVQEIQSLDKKTLNDSIQRFTKYKSIEHPNFHFKMGLYHYFLNLSKIDLENAVSYFKKTIELQPTNHQAFFWLAKAMIESIGLSAIKYREMHTPLNYLIKANQLSPNNPTYEAYTYELDKKFFKKYGLNNPLTKKTW